jgi:hypothetical protein
VVLEILVFIIGINYDHETHSHFHSLQTPPQPTHFPRCHIGTKTLIENYISAVQDALKTVLDDSSLDIKKKFEFFWETRQSFGRSALLLSGGASLGMIKKLGGQIKSKI